MNATYNALQYIGSYGRWMVFAMDGRSDIALSNSPWTDLANFNKFSLVSYDLPFNYDIWHDHYVTIFRANQVIDHVPTIANMDATVRARVVGEAKFIRALMYSNLVNLYGNVPMPLTSLDPASTTKMPMSTSAQLWAQIEKDLTEARAVLPATYSGADVGRATQGSADALLGKVELQQRKWTEASAALTNVITGNHYSLVPMSQWKDLFTPFGNNGPEAVFEVQMSTYNPDNGEVGLNIGKFCGPPQGLGPGGPGFGDCQPTQWLLSQYTDTAASGAVDPRRDLTIFHRNSSIQNVFGTPFAVRYSDRINDIFWKKWTMSDYRNFQDFDEPINYKVIRYADVLLMAAEARNELNDQAGARTYLNQVRARAGVTPVAAGLSQVAMRDAILHERVVELALEQSRWLDLKRQNLLANAASLATVKAHDAEFNFFTIGKSELLPIPQTEINTNPNARQNPNW
jgi:starch-binding outer membrane protein, SusD/RagB family